MLWREKVIFRSLPQKRSSPATRATVLVGVVPLLAMLVFLAADASAEEGAIGPRMTWRCRFPSGLKHDVYRAWAMDPAGDSLYVAGHSLDSSAESGTNGYALVRLIKITSQGELVWDHEVAVEEHTGRCYSTEHAAVRGLVPFSNDELAMILEIPCRKQLWWIRLSTKGEVRDRRLLSEYLRECRVLWPSAGEITLIGKGKGKHLVLLKCNTRGELLEGPIAVTGARGDVTSMIIVDGRILICCHQPFENDVLGVPHRTALYLWDTGENSLHRIDRFSGGAARLFQQPSGEIAVAYLQTVPQPIEEGGFALSVRVRLYDKDLKMRTDRKISGREPIFWGWGPCVCQRQPDGYALAWAAESCFRIATMSSTWDKQRIISVPPGSHPDSLIWLWDVYSTNGTCYLLGEESSVSDATGTDRRIGCVWRLDWAGNGRCSGKPPVGEVSGAKARRVGH